MNSSSRRKRKTQSSLSQSLRKKIKTSYDRADDLPWKTVSRPLITGVDGDDGIIDLEEVDDVEVVYEDRDGGRVVKFNVIKAVEDEKLKEESDDMDSDNEEAEAEDEDEAEDEAVVKEPTFDALPNWQQIPLDAQLLRGLSALHFMSPTPIQSKVIPYACRGRDVIGIAETGSGKTLAYGLPILHHLLSDKKAKRPKKRQLSALILAPTRELALQVSSHLKACLYATPKVDPVVKTETSDELPQSSKTSPSPIVSIAAIVGGMSVQKQQRILERGVDILIATPGRLWDIVQNNDDLARQISNLKFLVLDEADRMIETGHFAEMENILRLTRRQSGKDVIENDVEETPAVISSCNDQMQTFIFSATLSKDLQRNVKRKSRPKAAKLRQQTGQTNDLLLRLDFRDIDPEIIDLSPEGGVVSTLTESKIDCLPADKDAYLYYFLLRYPGRSLVFLGSIDGIRRLMPLMELLNIPAYPLHSQLEQRQRLKNLDRFKSKQNSVLLATDIAARGLDIPSVDHVIHYQTPRSADAYIHRNGRTARASRTGFSLLLCAPDEKRLVRTLLGNINRNEHDIPEMQVELQLMDKLKARIQLARKIDQAQHKTRKENHEKNWLKVAAEAMELDLGSDFDSGSDDDQPSKRQRKTSNAMTANMKAELKQLLSKPLVAKGISTKYITSGSRLNIDGMIMGDYNEAMLGVKSTGATEGVVVHKKKTSKKEGRVGGRGIHDEWVGIKAED